VGAGARRTPRDDARIAVLLHARRAAVHL
jgi:hypothetical protein